MPGACKACLPSSGHLHQSGSKCKDTTRILNGSSLHKSRFTVASYSGSDFINLHSCFHSSSSSFFAGGQMSLFEQTCQFQAFPPPDKSFSKGRLCKSRGGHSCHTQPPLGFHFTAVVFSRFQGAFTGGGNTLANHDSLLCPVHVFNLLPGRVYRFINYFLYTF